MTCASFAYVHVHTTSYDWGMSVFCACRISAGREIVRHECREQQEDQHICRNFFWFRPCFSQRFSCETSIEKSVSTFMSCYSFNVEYLFLYSWVGNGSKKKNCLGVSSSCTQEADCYAGNEWSLAIQTAELKRVNLGLSLPGTDVFTIEVVFAF